MDNDTMNLKPATATCHTEGCENCGIPIPIECDPDGLVICGPCSQEITDVVYA